MSDPGLSSSAVASSTMPPGPGPVSPSRPIFVFDFGSCYLRFSLSTDSEPHSIPHCVAYRKYNKKNKGISSDLEHSLDSDGDANMAHPASAAAVLSTPSSAASTDRWSHVSSLYRTVLKEMRKIANPAVHLRAPKWVSSAPSIPPTLPEIASSLKFLIAEKALNIPVEEHSDWSVVFPVVRGRLANVSAMSDIWIHSLRENYPDQSKMLSSSSAFVAVPDSFSRTEIRDLVNMLFSYPFQFGDVYVHSQAACALFGTGVGSGIVVNIGDAVTTLASVVDGYVYPPSRLVLPYGGFDIAETLHYIFKTLGGFPYPLCDVESRQLDRDIFYELLETYVHATPGHETFKSVTFTDPINHRTHRADCGDVLLLPAMGLIYPFIFDERGGLQLVSSRPQDDIVNERDNVYLEPYLPEDLYDEPFAYETSAPFRPRYFRTRETGIIEAIRECAARAVELFQSGKKSVAVDLSLLIIGGTSQIPGLTPLISDRSKLDVISLPEGMSPQNASWKGASYASGQLDRDHRLWISKAEWETGGIRYLREKSPFSF
eukprot:ANDGO_08106.mRNA.1 Actin-related protein 8